MIKSTDFDRQYRFRRHRIAYRRQQAAISNQTPLSGCMKKYLKPLSRSQLSRDIFD